MSETLPPDPPDPHDRLDRDACYRAISTRDARFDGRFFTCVTSTGIYCRPVCPARTPKAANVRFVDSAAAAEAAGFRACLRCRPETAPDLGAWRGTSSTVSRALRLIDAGALDDGDVEALADRLGVGERHLRRLFRRTLGAAPVGVAQTRRVLLAKRLLHETGLSMAEVALASGFGSVRRFNETFQGLYGRPPTSLRRGRGAAPGGLSLELAHRAPYDWPDMLNQLAVRGETVEGGRWRRDLAPDDGVAGTVLVGQGADGGLRLEADLAGLAALPGVLARVRRVLDLSADPAAIAAHLSADPALAPLVAARPGLRVAGDWSDPETEPHDALPDAWSTPDIEARVEAWRPWRGYAVRHLFLAGVKPDTLIGDPR